MDLLRAGEPPGADRGDPIALGEPQPDLVAGASGSLGLGGIQLPDLEAHANRFNVGMVGQPPLSESPPIVLRPDNLQSSSEGEELAARVSTICIYSLRSIT